MKSRSLHFELARLSRKMRKRTQVTRKADGRGEARETRYKRLRTLHGEHTGDPIPEGMAKPCLRIGI